MLLQHHASTNIYKLNRCKTSLARLPKGCFARKPNDWTRSSLCFVEAKRQSSSRHDGPQNSVAVLGGGITGLTTAYLLADTFPKLRIALIESKDVLGGWVRSKKVDVGNGEVLFEQGPRSLRPAPPNGTLALRMIQDLNLTSDLLITPKSSPAARNRFIYYPDHLVRMPGPRQPSDSLLGTIFSNLRTIITEPVFANVLRALTKEPSVDTRPSTLKDESVGAFVARRWHPSIANNLVSAMFHGIYAGDVNKLSAKSLMTQAWAMERKYGNLFTAMWAGAVERKTWGFCDDIALQMALQEVDWDERIREGTRDCSVFTLKEGLGQLTAALIKSLEKAENVQILNSTRVDSIEKMGDGSLQIEHAPAGSKATDANLQTETFTHAISTMPPSALVPLLHPKTGALHTNLAATPAATVLVVNLYFKTPNLLTTITPPGGYPRVDTLSGFGYLIPASVPFSQNPERALGVIFASDISPDLWNSVPPASEAEGEVGPGTKLTVMMGGHWWDGWSSYPSPEEAEEMALSVLERHLGITEKPLVCESNLQENCIPQYEVGHHSRMGAAHDALVSTFGDRIRVAGSWYTGVGVNDCLRGAWEVVSGLAADLKGEPVGWGGLGAAVQSSATGREKAWMKGKRTGLEGFKSGRPMVLTKRERSGTLEVEEVEKLGKEMGYFRGVKVEDERSGDDD